MVSGLSAKTVEVGGVEVSYSLNQGNPVIIVDGQQHFVTDLNPLIGKLEGGITDVMLASIAKAVAQALDDLSKNAPLGSVAGLHDVSLLSADVIEKTIASVVKDKLMQALAGGERLTPGVNYDPGITQAQYNDAVRLGSKSRNFELEGSQAKNELGMFSSIPDSYQISKNVQRHLESDPKEAAPDSSQQPPARTNTSRSNYVSPEVELAHAERNMAAINEHFSGEKTGFADQRLNADPKFFRRAANAHGDFDAACNSVISAPVNFGRQVGEVRKTEGGALVDKTAVMRSGEVSDLRNGWFSLDFLDRLENPPTPEKQPSKSDKFAARRNMVLDKSEDILAQMSKTSRLDGVRKMLGKAPAKLGIKVPTHDPDGRLMSKEERMDKALKMINAELAEIEKMGPNPKSGFLARKLQLQSCKRGLQQLEKLLPKVPDSRTQGAITKAYEDNTKAIRQAIMERQVALDGQMLQLVGRAAQSSPDAYVKVGGKVYFNLTYQGLVNCHKKELDKSGWMHDESVVMEDMQAMFERYQGTQIVFDEGEPAPFIQRGSPTDDGRCQTTIRLPTSYRPESVRGVDSCELRPLFFNIAPQSGTKHEGAQLGINDAAVQNIDRWLNGLEDVHVPADVPDAISQAQQELDIARSTMDDALRDQAIQERREGSKVKDAGKQWLQQLKVVQEKRAIVVSHLKDELRSVQQEISDPDNSEQLEQLKIKDEQIKQCLLKEDLLFLKNVIDEVSIRGKGDYTMAEKALMLSIISLGAGCMSAKDRTGRVVEGRMRSFFDATIRPDPKPVGNRRCEWISSSWEYVVRVTRRRQKLGSPLGLDTPSAQQGQRTEGDPALKVWDGTFASVAHLPNQAMREITAGGRATPAKKARAAVKAEQAAIERENKALASTPSLNERDIDLLSGPNSE